MLYGTNRTPTSRNNRNYHTQKQNKPHTKTKPNKLPHKQKNNAKNYKQNETKGENYAQKNYFYYLFIEKMKNTYIIAVKEWFEPVLITQQPNNDITYIGKHYKHAYIMESKQKAQETRKQRYKQREERKSDPIYKNTYF